EQRTENPCVPGSIPGGTTENERVTKVTLFSFISKNVIFSPMFKPRIKPKTRISKKSHTFCQPEGQPNDHRVKI
ncbi:hypothetical protein, partial [Butyricimonas faecihominis]|uniref:hypothetical protein n=2 Tax=Butyricimonas TaxID=574697 RepID=UPI0026DC6357